MNKNVTYVRNRLSLRKPQAESLEILADLGEKLSLRKGCDLAAEFEKVQADYPSVTDFERDFPCICFALATGVGKTRLMGAFITYLYLQKNIRNFFVLAPNLTIYNKLIEDFSNPQNPKYVFPGIGDFAQKPPRIITGDNYATVGAASFLEDSITINVFNISKINAETKGGKAPRIKRLSEYIGESYFDYLSNLDDLVLLMDESHHYRAERGMQVINELNPILGLELTATPQTEKSGKAVPFKNIVYQYSLGKAMEDGFVKEPAIATRKNFNPNQYTEDELDRIKLEDGIRIHEDTKVELDIYARNEKVRPVKPFVLVVTKDTEHAGKIKEIIQSPSFFNGRYADKVMEIHSNQRGEEKDENIQRLLALESPLNKTEIVIHVNMLKEGWDVTNLYTIIPLRTATSMTLREQTIGRGLRLPYGKRTGNDTVDKLTIVAHDKFQEIIDEANKPDSIIKKQNIVEIDPSDFDTDKEVIVSKPNVDEAIEAKEKQIEIMEESPEKEKATVMLAIERAIYTAIPSSNSVTGLNDLEKPEIKELVIEKAVEPFTYNSQLQMVVDTNKEEIAQIYETAVKAIKENTIEIPRIIIQPSDEATSCFEDFDLEVKNLNYQPISEEILVKFLQRTENDLQVLASKLDINLDKPENLIVSELINYPQVDYDEQTDLLYKLVNQAITHLESYLDYEQAVNVVKYHKRDIAKYIYTQMKDHFYYTAKSYEKPKVLPFTKIEPHNLAKNTNEGIYLYSETITPTSAIPQKIFGGFTKACHRHYKFDNKSEKDFVAILEKDSDVKKWLRPAPRQFYIYWDNNSRLYEPDFVVETYDTIYLVEVKRESDISDHEVQEKAKAALQYCKYASEYTVQHGGKPWKYLLIPHNEVVPNMSFEYLAKKHEFKG